MSPITIYSESMMEEDLYKIPPISDQKLSENQILIEDSDAGDRRKRKILHRDIERHRRKEMADLFASLRSLVPIEYLKGKRSISDHMSEIMNYIKNTQGGIQLLREKRDKLLFNSQGNMTNKDVVCCVSVDSCLERVEIQMKCLATNRRVLLLSKVLDELINSNLRVTCCVFTRYDNELLYAIQSKIVDSGDVDLVLLKRKLMDVAIGSL